MHSHPFLSIIIPTWNSELFLEECLKSIRNQTEDDYEVIVVDKQSSDNTIRIIESFDFPRITILEQSGDTLSEALNQGFQIAQGSLLCWLNSDDAYARPDALEIIKRYSIRLKSSSLFLYANHLCINKLSIITSLLSCQTKTYVYERKVGGTNICTGSMFFSKSLFNSFGGFNPALRLAFEYPLIDFLFLNAHSHFIGAYIHAYRTHPEQLSQRESVRMKEESYQIDSIYPSPPITARIVWLVKRILSRLLYSNPLQRHKWRGKSLAAYWDTYLSK
jgi:glycosyltransferase involved in cell wall biosynthesis